MEVGRDETIKLDKDGGASGEEEGMLADRSEGGVGLPFKERKKDLQELEKAVKNLKIDADPEEMSNLILELERAREKAIAEKRRAARVAWREKSRKEVRERSQFQDRMVFMLPEEWEAILKAVKDPKDKRVMSDMLLLWRAETKRERTRYLFPEVFQILRENNHLSGTDMLDCRVACQEWRNSVDLRLERDVKYERKNVIVNLMKDWESIARFREWCTQTYAADGNPFPSRKVMIGNIVSDGDGIGNPLQMAGPYWREVELLLREWGGEVWEAVVMFDEGLNFRALCLNIQRFLRLMPNLRCFNMFCKDLSEQGRCRVTPTTQNERDMNKLVAETFLPDMAHLKLIDLSFVPPALINALVGKYRSTLETLMVYSGANNPCEYGGGTVLPRLKTFVANGNFVRMEPLVITLDWTGLEEFVLTFHELAAVNLPQIFTISNRFGGTLRSLSLDLQNKNGPLSKLDEKQLKKLRLDLPRVEKFSLTVGRLNLKGVDFILPMAALKELSVTYYKLEKKQKKKKTQPGVGSASSSTGNGNSGEIIKFSDYMNRLYESNIWTVLPDLREVTISVFKLKAPSAVPASMESIIAEMGEQRMPTKQKIYTREGYKKYLTSGSGSGGGGGDGTGSN